MKNIITTGLNQYLDCDPERVNQLRQIDGKIIAIVIKELDLSLFWRVVDLQLESIEEKNVSCDVELIISLKALPNYLLGVDRNELIKNGDVEIIGDTHVASVFNNTLKSIEIDWEELLSKRTGDAFAHQAAVGASKLSRLIKQIKENVRLDTRDYLQDKLQVAVTQVEVDEFIRDVDKLRAQVDRLEARLQRLSDRS